MRRDRAAIAAAPNAPAEAVRDADKMLSAGEQLRREIRRLRDRADSACAGRTVPPRGGIATTARAERDPGWLRAGKDDPAYWNAPSDYSAYPERYDPQNTVDDPERDARDYCIVDCDQR